LGALVALGALVLPNDAVTFATRVGNTGCGLMSGEVMAQAVRTSMQMKENAARKGGEEKK